MGFLLYVNLYMDVRETKRQTGSSSREDNMKEKTAIVTDTNSGLSLEQAELIYIPMSSGLSGSCGTAAGLAREYGGKVHVIDNHRISVTLRQSALEAKYMAEQGKSTEEIVKYLEADGMNASIYVSVNTLMVWYKKS